MDTSETIANEDESVLKQFLDSEKGSKLDQTVGEFVSRLKRREFVNSYELAAQTVKTLTYLVRFVAGRKDATSIVLIQCVRAVGRRLIRARPVEIVIGNAVRRVLYTIREEKRIIESADDSSSQRTEQSEPKLHIMLKGTIKGNGNTEEGDLNASLGEAITDGLQEIMGELDNYHEPIAKQALEHIHADDVLLVSGASKTIQMFLQEANKKRDFEVIVAEGAPECHGHNMAQKLCEIKISTTVITDSAIMAMMSRVNKVLISPKAILANGGLLAQAGTHMIALAAKHYRIPLVCVSGLHKLSPLYAHDIDAFADLKSPGRVFDYGEVPANVDVLSPHYDYIPPELVSLFITNSGGHLPSYVYRLLAEYYDQADNNIYI